MTIAFFCHIMLVKYKCKNNNTTHRYRNILKVVLRFDGAHLVFHLL